MQLYASPVEEEPESRRVLISGEKDTHPVFFMTDERQKNSAFADLKSAT